MNALARKTLLAIALCGALLCARADDGVKLYMGAESLPNALEFLPPPPDTASVGPSSRVLLCDNISTVVGEKGG